ncbi:MAG TPA: glycosyltransferase, partial [Ramlibacter sp.]
GQVLEQARATARELQTELAQARARSEDKDKELAQVYAHLAAERAQAAQVAAWAQRMDSAPLRYALKRHGYRYAKAVYRRLPVSQAMRHRMRSVALRVLSRLRPGRGQAAAGDARAAAAATDWPIVDFTGPSGANRDVFVFAVIDWHFRIQRPQHLARGLARAGRRVFSISNNFVDAAEPGFQIERLDPSLELYQVRLHVPGAPAIYFAQPTPEIQRAIELGLARLIGAHGATSTVSLLQHPYWLRNAFALPNSIRVYDCMDHHEGFGNVPAELIAAEKEMLRRSDLVVVTSGWLEEMARPEARSIAMVRNAGEYSHFADRPAEVFRDADGRRVIGYYGAIAEWFDIELVRAVARANPDCLVLLVGNDTVQAARALRDVKNVQFTGEVPYGRLPFYLWGFDVCLLPFQVIPLTLATNPVKVYEYLSAGKPVVAVDLPEIAQFGELVRKAGSHEAFIAEVREALADPGSPPAIEARRTFAREQTWDHRVADLAKAVEQLDWPTVSVVVLTYNNLQLTQDCLASLVRESDYAKLEIIVVDNASKDGTPDWLRGWHAENPSAKVILNEDNLGFAAGNNVGLAASTGDYLVILNNDTVVTRGWVRTMLRHLQNDPNAGLVGPVTNNIGNEARVETTYGNDLAAMRPQAMRQTLTHMGRHFRLRTAAFFCVMLPRSTYETCGPLCEDYGLGFFEDDDYCRRVEAAGLYCVCAEDVFVHHHLSASFGKLPTRQREELFQRNKEIYEAKWGAWQAHSYERTAAVPAQVAAAPAPAVAQQPSVFEGQQSIEGTCCICGNRAKFFYTDEALWREQLNCSECRATARYRALALGLLRGIRDLTGVQASSLAALPGDAGGKRLRAYDCQPPFYYLPCSYPLPDLLKNSGWIDVELTQFKPEMTPGALIRAGVTNQNLEALTYEDASLDLVITSDVMEHGRLPERAHREIHRVLRTGGLYLFNVPHDLSREHTVVRVQVHDPMDPGKDEHLMEPEYHGDTNGDGSGVLAYRFYGRDLIKELQDLGFEVEYIREDLPELGIRNAELFYCRKVRN